MNESKFAVRSVRAWQWGHLTVFRFNRRCLLICLVLIASLRLVARENRSVVPRPAPISSPLAGPSPVRASPPSPAVRLPAMMSESAAWRVTDLGRKKAPADRWEKFEIEFGITKKEPSLVLGTVQTAKYNLDSFLFTVDDLAQSLSDSLELEYDKGKLYRVASLGERPRRDFLSPSRGIAENARLRLDLNMDSGRPYVGLKLVVPLGN